MDISQIYMASPDWIKGLMVARPFLTVYATARLFAPRIKPSAESQPLPITFERMPASPARSLLEHDKATVPLIARMEPMKEES